MMQLGEEVRTLKHKLLVFALPALIIFILVSILIVQKQNLLAPKTRLFIFPPTAAGISPGLPVTLKGIHVGEVETVNIDKGNLGETMVKASLLVLSRYAYLIPHNSQIRLTKEGLIGQSNLEIFPGQAGSRPIANNDTLTFATSSGLSDVLEEVRPVVSEAGTLLKSFNSESGKFQQTLDNSNKLVLDLSESSKTMTSALESTKQTVHAIGTEVSATMQTTRDTLVSVKETVGKVGEESEATLSKTREQVGQVGNTATEALEHTKQAADSAKETVEATHSAIEKTGARADQMMNEADSLVRDANEIISGAKRAWPIKNWVAPPERKQLPIDSGEYDNAQP